ncbi:MAG: hypothetical protein HY735_12495 [Verrucomicrobia bacterium]|nr:hypothetical protein [Verrucomicrobiota bacterium]
MSEYQYYEFQAIDRRLGEKEMQELRGYSSRARITATSFVNEYSFGSFKGNADVWMEKYFDGYLYSANWGTHVLQLRLPAKLLSAETAQLYCQDDPASVREKSGNVILTFRSEEEGGGEWVDADGLLSSILPIRDDLARGDLRSLYLAWLLCVQEGDLDDDHLEPPVPANLGELSGPLSSLAEFLRIDSDLLDVAEEASPRIRSDSSDRREMSDWVASLPAKEKDELLLRLMDGGDAHLGTELCSRFRRTRSGRSPVAESPRRTVAALRSAAEDRELTRRDEAARKVAEEFASRKREAALVRERHLDAVAGRVPELWKTVDDLIATKLPKNYDAAVLHLVDLRDLATRHGTQADFAERIAAVRDAQSRKPSFIDRLNRIGL